MTPINTSDEHSTVLNRIQAQTLLVTTPKHSVSIQRKHYSTVLRAYHLDRSTQIGKNIRKVLVLIGMLCQYEERFNRRQWFDSPEETLVDRADHRIRMEVVEVVTQKNSGTRRDITTVCVGWDLLHILNVFRFLVMMLLRFVIALRVAISVVLLRGSQCSTTALKRRVMVWRGVLKRFPSYGFSINYLITACSNHSLRLDPHTYDRNRTLYADMFLSNTDVGAQGHRHRQPDVTSLTSIVHISISSLFYG